jgi:hypothetical protein
VLIEHVYVNVSLCLRDDRSRPRVRFVPKCLRGGSPCRQSKAPAGGRIFRSAHRPARCTASLSDASACPAAPRWRGRRAGEPDGERWGASLLRFSESQVQSAQQGARSAQSWSRNQSKRWSARSFVRCCARNSSAFGSPSYRAEPREPAQGARLPSCSASAQAR